MATYTIHSDLYISGPGADLSDLMPQGQAVRNGRNGLSIVLVTNGEASICIDHKSYQISRGSVVVLMPFHFIASVEQSPDLCIQYICFDFDFMADFPLLLPAKDSERFSSTPCQQATKERFEALMRRYDTILEYYLMQEHPYRLGIVKAQLFTLTGDLLFYFSDNIRTIHSKRSEEITANFFKLLHRHHQIERSLAFYANHLCVTTKYLSKVIARTSGHTVYFWIEEFTVKRAKEMLGTSQATVCEIAERLNFANSSFFAKFFRRHAGCSPTEFRQSINSRET